MKNILPQSTSIGLLLITLLFSLQTNAQPNFEKADSIAANFAEECETPEELAQKLTTSLDTPIEKARVFFMWIAHNVRYDCKKFLNPKPVKFEAFSEKELQQKEEEWKKKQILKTIKFQKGICEDYSSLFKALCDEVGLEAVVVRGIARDFSNPYRNHHNNLHAWNAVKIDDEWHLLDATWGAGHINAEVTRFTRKITSGFFFTPPHLFTQNHFPEEEKWQLLDKPLTKEEFANQTLINYTNTNFKITDFAPAGEKEADKKNKTKIWLQFENPPKAIGIATKKGKQIDFDRVDEDGKVILSIDAPFSRNVTIFGGNSYKGKLEWLAIYEL